MQEVDDGYRIGGTSNSDAVISQLKIEVERQSVWCDVPIGRVSAGTP
jgi:hypothetical protein